MVTHARDGVTEKSDSGTLHSGWTVLSVPSFGVAVWLLLRHTALVNKMILSLGRTADDFLVIGGVFELPHAEKDGHKLNLLSSQRRQGAKLVGVKLKPIGEILRSACRNGPCTHVEPAAKPNADKRFRRNAALPFPAVLVHHLSVVSVPVQEETCSFCNLMRGT